MPDAAERLADLLALDDGTTASDVRIALAHLLVGIRAGSLDGIGELMEASDQLVPRLTEPHLISSFYFCHAFLAALQGHYARALALGIRCERYAVDVRLPFVVPHAQLVKAMAELGLRHFARCNRLLDRIDRNEAASTDIFNQVESRLLRARMLVAQGLARRAVESLADPPRRFPFEGEHGEYLATLALAQACSGDRRHAIALAEDAVETAQTVEIQSLTACARAIVAIEGTSAKANEQTLTSVETVLRVGGIDSFVTAYRGYPPLLERAGSIAELRNALLEITAEAHDWGLASSSLSVPLTRRGEVGTITRREREVLELITQGLTNKDIARTLFISEATAKVHVRHILRKLSVNTRTEAAVKASELDDSGG